MFVFVAIYVVLALMLIATAVLAAAQSLWWLLATVALAFCIKRLFVGLTYRPRSSR